MSYPKLVRSASQCLPPNKKVGDYTFHNANVLGEGSYSTVYLGQHEESKYPVAIKVIARKSLVDNYMYETLASEIEILKKLDHPNIVRLYDVLNTTNNVYIITEYCNGGTLDDLLRKEKKLNENQAVFVMKDLLNGFQEILKHNIVHRDIKPANVFVSDGRFKIGDFGFAKKVDDLNEPMMKSIVGTPLYMSPECLENKLYSSKNDVYSLGIIFFKLLYGRTPWPSKTRAELMQNMRASPLIIPDEESISMASKQFLLLSLRHKEFERINWQDIYDYPLFREEKKVVEPIVVETKGVEEVFEVKPNKAKIDEEVYEVKREEVVEIKDFKEEKETKPNVIGTHVRIIKKIDTAVKLLKESNDVSKSQALKLGVLLMRSCQHFTSDLSKRVQEMKLNGNSSQVELMTQIEQEVLELEHKNQEELKILTRFGKRHQSLIHEEVTIEQKPFFEEVLESLKPMIRECNHRAFIRNRGETGENRNLVELLHELIGMYQIIVKCRLREGDVLGILDGITEEIFENENCRDYQALRRLIYELAI